MIKKYEGFLNFFKGSSDDTSDIVEIINSIVNPLNDINNVEVNPSKRHIIKGNNSKKIKVVFAVSINKDSIFDFLNELENVNSHLSSENFTSNLYFLNSWDYNDIAGHIITKKNYLLITSDIYTDPSIDEQMLGLYLVVKNIDNKSNYIF